MSVLIGAATGAVFGGLGALLGLIVARLPSVPEKSRAQLVSVFAIAAAVASQPLANAFIRPYFAFIEAEKRVQAIPTFAVIKEHYPADYARINAKLKVVLTTNSDPVAAANSIRAELGPVVERAVPRANAANTVALLRLVRDEAKAVRGVSQEECGRFVSTGGSTIDLGKAFGPELRDRDIAVMSTMLKQAATAPHRWPAQADKGQFDALVVRAMNRARGPDRALIEKWAAAGARPDDLPATCVFSIVLFEEILSLPEGQAAEVFQAMTAAGTAPG